MAQGDEEVVAGLADDIIQLIEEKGAELTQSYGVQIRFDLFFGRNFQISENVYPTQSRKGMLSERKKALSGVEKLHNYTKIGDFKSLNGEGKQVLSVDVSRANNDRFVTGGQNNSVSFFLVEFE